MYEPKIAAFFIKKKWKNGFWGACHKMKDSFG